MASTTDYDSDLAGDTLTATAKKKQTSFDQTNLPAQYQQPAAAPAATSTPAGPVGRAALQLPETTVTATAPTAAPTQSLESLRPTGIGDGRSAIYAGVGANGEASFSNLGSTLNTLNTNFTAPNQAPDQRLSAMPGLNPMGNGVQQPVQRVPTSLADLSPAGPSTANAPQPAQRSASLTDALPGYTSSVSPPSPATQQGANLANAWQGGSSSGPDFAALGSAANVGDGVGTFSQANQGDAQLAMSRFQKAADLRESYKAQDRLAQAQGEKWQADHTNVVHDSSRPITARELKTDAAYDQMRRGANLNVDLAQAGIDTQQNRQVAGQQLRQSQRLEDIMTAAQSPAATPEQIQAARRATDPDGTKAAALQLTQAKTQEAQGNAAKLAAEASGNTPDAKQKAEKAKQDAQLAQLEIQRRQTEVSQQAQTAATQKTSSLDIAKRARDLAKTIGSDSQFSKITGTIDSMTPTFFGDNQDLINQASQLQTLLTADNLKLMSGVLTDKDIAFLTQIGSGLNVTKNGINGSEEGVKKILDQITGRLNAKIDDSESGNTVTPSLTTASPQASKPVDHSHLWGG
jgi:hypothetical protein